MNRQHTTNMGNIQMVILTCLAEQLEEGFPGLELRKSNTHGNGYDMFSDDIEVLYLDCDGLCVFIHEIYSRSPGHGLGDRVINSIVAFCFDEALTCMAIDVLPGATAFWERKGFIPLFDGTDDWAHAELFPHHLALVA